MSHHNYTNPAFCRGSEFYPVSDTASTTDLESPTKPPKPIRHDSESAYNRSLNLQYSAPSVPRQMNPREGPLRIQRSVSTRSFISRRAVRATAAAVHASCSQHAEVSAAQQREQKLNSTMPLNPTSPSPFETRSNSGRYALVPVEELHAVGSSRYAIVPGPGDLSTVRRFAKSQDNLEYYGSQDQLQHDEEPTSFHDQPHSFSEQCATDQYTSLPTTFAAHATAKRAVVPPVPPKIKHAFSSDFGSKTFLIVDKNSNQRYQMVPTAEDEELVDDNQEVIQLHNGRAHRYAVIPTEDDDDVIGSATEEEETCLSNPDLNQSQLFTASHMDFTRKTAPRTSTPQRSTPNTSYPATPLKNPIATKMLHELIATPPKTPLPRCTTSRHIAPAEQLHAQQSNQEHQHTQQRLQHRVASQYRSQQQLYHSTPERHVERAATQSLHYESVKPHSDRTTAVITPRVTQSKVYPQLEEEDCSSIHGKSCKNNSHPEKVASAAVTLAVISLMLVISSTVNSALIIYMIAHMGKSFYLQFSLLAAFSGVALGGLGFRARLHCDWMPNRSYTSGYILVTVFCLLKCCGLVVILVLDPYPGLPFHDVTTGIILGLSAFTLFFIGLGVIGSVWCHSPPPDNRVNVA